jgi:hypothetical protein
VESTTSATDHTEGVVIQKKKKKKKKKKKRKKAAVLEGAGSTAITIWRVRLTVCGHYDT